MALANHLAPVGGLDFFAWRRVEGVVRSKKSNYIDGDLVQ